MCTRVLAAWALAAAAAGVAAVPGAGKKELLPDPPPPVSAKKLLAGGGWTRTTANSEPHQHFRPPPNHHLPEHMSYAEFSRRFVDHNMTIHDPTSEDYRPFALPPPSIRQGVDPREVFDRLDVDGSADLTVPELKEMRNLPDAVQMPEASMAGIQLPYFESSFGERMREDVDVAAAFEALDGDSNGVLTRKEAKEAQRFFRDDLRRRR